MDTGSDEVDILRSDGKRFQMARALARLIVYFRTDKWPSYQSWSEAERLPQQCIAFSEAKFLRFFHPLSPFTKRDMIDFTSRAMCRVYPANRRITSSNFDPYPYWQAGCQMVALNYQTPGRPMQLAQALFSQNRGCGYLLKPDMTNAARKTAQVILRVGMCHPEH